MSRLRGLLVEEPEAPVVPPRPQSMAPLELLVLAYLAGMAVLVVVAWATGGVR